MPGQVRQLCFAYRYMIYNGLPCRFNIASSIHSPGTDELGRRSFPANVKSGEKQNNSDENRNLRGKTRGRCAAIPVWAGLLISQTGHLRSTCGCARVAQTICLLCSGGECKSGIVDGKWQVQELSDSITLVSTSAAAQELLYPALRGLGGLDSISTLRCPGCGLGHAETPPRPRSRREWECRHWLPRRDLNLNNISDPCLLWIVRLYSLVYVNQAAIVFGLCTVLLQSRTLSFPNSISGDGTNAYGDSNGRTLAVRYYYCQPNLCHE